MARLGDEGGHLGGCWPCQGYRSLAAECSAWGDSSSAVSREQSDSLSRSHTIYGALLRLGLLSCSPQPARTLSPLLASLLPQAVPPSLELHVVGADGREGRTPAQSARVFSPLCRLLRPHGVSELRLLLIGPHVEQSLHGTTHTASSPGEASAGLTLEYSSQLYHERDGSAGPAAVAFLFNAGIWGYPSWLPTVSWACRAGGAARAVVVTSYNEFEAADDRDTLEDAVEGGAPGFGPGGCGGLAWAWGPESNPFASKLLRSHCDIEQRQLADNSHWQCFSSAVCPPAGDSQQPSQA